MSTFPDVQNGFYNALCQGLGLSTGTFQVLQPTPPLLSGPGADAFLWGYFNNIPPFSLTQNYIASGGNQFFSDYKGLISALKAPPSSFQSDIGPNAFQDWRQFLPTLNPHPAVSQLPDVFFNWAFVNYPDVADIGSADLSAMLLDPISSAGLALDSYRGRPPDWTLAYNDLLQLLANAPSVSFNFASSQMNSDVSTSWTGGSNSGFFGLWGGSDYSSTVSSEFAASSITLSASFAHVLTFQASPGAWYTSSAIGDAYSHQSGDPWNPSSTINWQNTFDPQNGNMARFMVNLIIVDTMSVSIYSDGIYSAEFQQAIQNNSSGGLWPFYTSGSSGGAVTSIQFDDQGHMSVQVNTAAGVPMVIGGNVLSVDRFVGHAVEGARIFAARRG